MKPGLSPPDPDALAASQAIFRKLKRENPAAVSGGLYNGFAHILCDPAYEVLNPAVYADPMPHLRKNKLLMQLLMGHARPDITLDEMLARIRTVHAKNGLMEGDLLRPEYADVFRYIIGALAMKTIDAAATAADGTGKPGFSPGEKSAIVSVFSYASRGLGAPAEDNPFTLATFVKNYEERTVLHPVVSVTTSARNAVRRIIEAEEPGRTLSAEQMKSAISPALRKKLRL